MAEYKALEYKTRGGSSPQGKPRVFFCCHPDDFERFFEPVVKEIQDIQLNAAIWYYDPKKVIPDCEEFFDHLSEMQLFVIPVTSNFLYKDSQARLKEFPYAIEHNIPVLPLMQEPGLIEDFNQICGDLQCLDKFDSKKDPTVIPYEEKLKKYLGSLLVGDELAARIREAFDAYIFLSYRKIDRRYAQHIMRLIHQNDFCQDVAIWYDEFLKPGEDFTHAIIDALHDCDLFAMVVTKNLLEEKNYVLTKEYPEALKTGKPILPIEGETTDIKQLSKMYEGITHIITEEDLSEQLSINLRDIALRAKKDDSEHNFLIGLAYLSGIDVEVNHEKALSLITLAAETGFEEAYEKLVSMYQNGEGVKRDYDTAIEWQKRYVSYLKNQYATKQSAEAAEKIVLSLFYLGEYQNDNGSLSDAKLTLQNAIHCSEEMEKFQKTGLAYISIFYCRLGLISLTEGNSEEAKEWIKKGLKSALTLSAEADAVDAYIYIYKSCIVLGYANEFDGNLEEAKKWYLKAKDISQEKAEKTKTVESRLDLSDSFINLGNVSRIEGNLKDAKDLYLKAKNIGETIAGEISTIKSREKLSFSYKKLGDIAQTEENLEEARDWYIKSKSIRQAMAEETNVATFRTQLSDSFIDLGDISKAEEKLEEAKDWYLKAKVINEAIAEETNVKYFGEHLCNSYQKLGDINKAEGNLEEAQNWYLKEMKIAETLATETGIVNAHGFLTMSLICLGDISQTKGNPEKAKDWYFRAKDICYALVKETNTVDFQWLLSRIYTGLGNITKSERKLKQAKDWYLKSKDIDEAIAEETDTVKPLENLYYTYIKLGDISRDQSVLKEAKAWYLKAMNISQAKGGKTNTTDTLEELCLSYSNLGDISKDEDNYEEAKDWYLKGLKTAMQLVEIIKTDESLHCLALFYGSLAEIAYFQRNTEEMVYWYEKYSRVTKEFTQETNITLN